MTSFLQTVPHPAPFTGDALAHLQEVFDDLPELPAPRVGDDCPDSACGGELIRHYQDEWDYIGYVLCCESCCREVALLP